MKKIFLCEPDSGIFDVISIVLQAEGYVVEALPDHNSKNFIQRLTSCKPDLVIIDCFLDQVKPTKLCLAIKSMFTDVGVIASSCNNDIDETYSRMGFDGYLPKPFSLENLTSLVKYYSQLSVVK